MSHPASSPVDPVTAPVTLAPELATLADPGGEVLMSAEPAFVQRAAFPVDAEPATGSAAG
jgi:hypothetical protein